MEVGMRYSKQSGQAIWFVAVGLIVLVGFAGLGMDMGLLRYERRLQQTAADGVAVAEAKELNYFSSIDSTTATNSSASNGFASPNVVLNTACPATVTQLTVTVNNPPLSGPHNGDNNYVEACVTAPQPTFFMQVFGVNSETINARAVATNFKGPQNTSGNGCIYTLGPPSNNVTANSAGIGSSGSVILNAPTCGINDNGNLVLNGGANLSITAASIGYASDGTYNPPSSSATVTPTPVPIPYTGDPYSNSYTAPTVGSIAGTISASSGSVTTFSPGTYVGGTINAGAEVLFNPGVYVIDGGTLKINGGAEVCGGGTVSDWSSGAWSSTTAACVQDAAGDGVTFYVTNNATVTVDGTAAVQMYAPNSGSYEGLLFWQDASDTNDMTLSGNSASFYQGLIYGPSMHLIFGGNAGFNNDAQYTVIVVNDLEFHGNPDVNLKSNYSGLANGGGPLTGTLSSATLVE
jgi:hypothetical protein